MIRLGPPVLLPSWAATAEAKTDLVSGIDPLVSEQPTTESLCLTLHAELCLGAQAGSILGSVGLRIGFSTAHLGFDVSKHIALVPPFR